jgi:hypothetical protein
MRCMIDESLPLARNFSRFACFPDAVRRETVRRCCGIAPDSASLTIPGLQCITPLRLVLHCARQMWLLKGCNAPLAVTS